MKNLIALLLLCVSTIVGADTVPSINASNSANKVDTFDLKMMFTGVATKWDNGLPVVVVILPADSDLSREFLFRFLGMQPQQYYDKMRSRINRGDGKIISVQDAKAALVVIIKNDGAIGYLDEKTIAYNRGGQIKILKVE